MKKIIARGILPAALMMVSSASVAGGQDNILSNKYNDHQGFYLSGDIGPMFSTYKGNGGYHGFGLGGALGYMFNQYIGLEAQLFDNVANAGLSIFGNFNQLWYGGALKLNLPVGSNVGLFLKGGVGGLYTSGNLVIFGTDFGSWSYNDIGGIVGGGIGYSFNRNSELSLEANGIIVSPEHKAGTQYASYITMLGLAYTYHFQ